MLKSSILITVLLITNSLFLAQENHLLTSREKAYFFHTVKKSPILDKNLGDFLVYNGPEILFQNGDVNYDSTELLIINDPSLLLINSAEIQKAPKGLLAEAANKHAVWELNKTLHAFRNDELEIEGFSNNFDRFYRILLKKLPPDVVKLENDSLVVDDKVMKIMHPSLAFNDKLAILKNFKGGDLEIQKKIFDGLNKTINLWVQERSFELFKKYGGRADEFVNILTAAGDGSNTSGLFEEREKDESGRWNKGLPKAVGLFPYPTEIITDPKNNKRKKLTTQRYSQVMLETAGYGRSTNIHLDVWGYNSEKQTTVVIEKKGNSYPLFGSTDSRFLSPDSSFSGDGTYYTLINRLQSDIHDIEDKISGRKGYDYWIDYHENRKKDKLEDIHELEKEMSDFRKSTITTNDRKYKTKSGKRKRKKQQDALVRYHDQLSAIRKKIKEYEEKREKALYEIQVLNQRLNHMLDLIGRNWMSFKEKDGLYIYEDSTTFNILTQEFQFPPTDKPEDFVIRLVPIPFSHMSEQVDEVMLHINMTDIHPHQTAQVQIELEDAFPANSYRIDKNLINPEDSISIKTFLKTLTERRTDFKIIPRASGVGKWNGFFTIKDDEQDEMSDYPGGTSEEKSNMRNDSAFVRLRKTMLTVDIENDNVVLKVNSFTDPVRTNFKPEDEDLLAKMKRYELSGNQMLSAYRTAFVLEQFRKELNIFASQNFSRKDAKTIIDRLNKKIGKTKIYVGKTSFLISDFNIN